jgi:hypothetical protein
MFEPSSHSNDPSSGNGAENSKKKPSQNDLDRNLPRGVYGVKVRTTSHSYDSEEDGIDVSLYLIIMLIKIYSLSSAIFLPPVLSNPPKILQVNPSPIRIVRD